MGKMDSIKDSADGGVTKRCMAACEDQNNDFQLSTLHYPSGVTFRLRGEVCDLIASLTKRCDQRAKRIILDEVYPELCVTIRRLNGSDPCSRNGLLSFGDIDGFK